MWKIHWVFPAPIPHIKADSNALDFGNPAMSEKSLDEEALFHAARRIADPAAARARYREFLQQMARADGARAEIAAARRAVAADR